MTLLDSGSQPAATVTVVPAEGTYTLDAGTGVITFTPANGFTGVATPVTYKLTAEGLSATSTYTPTVGPPPGPAAAPLTSTGVGTTPQTATVASCEGCTVTRWTPAASRPPR
ncbi:hypothetical protein ACFPIJ_59100 [Dactylosporangium cerinum]|uniref:CshA domain-containing protein n=1 Tax=Dactylosporangium cerinum TaxID=1434730 RepID=A0ABV9WJ99_9ACTN